jgi:hypothetical protein
MARLVSALQQNSRRRDMANQVPALRVLIADDEPLICWSLAETLSGCGDVVTEAKTARGASGLRTPPPRAHVTPCPMDWPWHQ